ncbi:NmrA family transcriptional regulator [Kineosporia sp. NBRC 101677]|uniref:NmrA family NAD(P)-binding protein n=1 Tax=Kineosporia sp. NBRC 101677 TaxID=3032197 RepID=UPI0024A3A24A|nr:NmrA family NAD(P)-binding protein [Kineosporia sp. NBRC 101677]GLY19649.1 NmrA family transcriptional regulator [Kineosporia sp. NBRC 101677]
MSRRFLITGATGKTGLTSVRLLREKGHAVTAFVHRDDERSRALADLGADVVVGDLRDVAAVADAARGAEGLYFCYPVAPGLIEATAAVAQAAAEAGVATVVNMSQVSARRNATSNAARQHWLSERLLDRGPFAVTHLQPTFFADWLAWGWYEQGEEGVIGLPFGQGRHAPITGDDQARVIAAVLEDPRPHAGRTYRLYGREELDHTQIAAVVGRVLGRPVRYDPIDIEIYRTGLLARGVSEHTVQHFANVALDYRNGIFAGTNDAVQQITGHEPTSVADFVAANRNAFQGTGLFAVPTSVQES